MDRCRLAACGCPDLALTETQPYYTDKSIDKHPSAGSKRQARSKKKGKAGRGSVVRGETLNTQWSVYRRARKKQCALAIRYTYIVRLIPSSSMHRTNATTNNRVFRSLPRGKGSPAQTEVQVESQVCSACC